MATIVTTSYKNPGTVIANGQTTGNGWTNPNNILIVDETVAESNPSAASDIIIGNYPFAIPTNAIITGIEFRIRAYRGAQTSPEPTITIYAVNNETGEDVFTPYTTPLDGLTPDLEWYDLGGPTYLFDQAWTVDQINNLKLQLVANADIYVDAVPARVSYYVPDPSPTPEPVGENGDNCNSQVQALPFTLKIPFNIGDDVVYFNNFNLPNGQPIENTDLGDFGGAFAFTVEPGIAAGNGNSFMENFAALKSDIQDVPGAVKFDVLFRGIDFVTPFGPKTDNQSNHGAGSEVILTNNGYYEDRWLKKCHVGVLVSAPITVEDEDVPLADPAEALNFKGAGVVVVNDPDDSGRKVITIPGAGGVTPPVVVETGSGTSGASQVTSLTYELTSSGLNRIVLVQISVQSGVTVTGVTYAGLALTQAKSVTAGGLKVEQWFRIAPPIGTDDVVITLSGAAYISSGAECIVNVDQTDPIGDDEDNTGASTEVSDSLTTTADYSMVFDAIATQDAPIIYTLGAGQLQNWQESSVTTVLQGASSYQPAGLTGDVVVMSWSLSKSAIWLTASVEILGISVAVPGSGQSAIQFQDEDGVDLGLPGTVDEFQITGPNVTAVRAGNKVTYTIAEGAGSGGSGSGGTRLVVDTTQVITPANTSENTIYSEAIPAGTLSTNNAIKFKVLFSDFGLSNSPDEIKTIRLKYGSTTIATVVADIGSNPADLSFDGIYLEGWVIANNATNAQKGQLEIFSGFGDVDGSNFINADYGTSAIDSTITQNLVITIQSNVAGTASVTAEAIVIEKIGGASSGSISEQNLGGSGVVEEIPTRCASSLDGTVAVSAVYPDAFGVKLTRYEKDANTGAYLETHSILTANIERLAGVIILGVYVYLIGTNVSDEIIGYRYDIADLTNQTALTFDATYDPLVGDICYTDGTDLFISTTSTVVRRFTISGTTLTSAGTITSAWTDAANTVYMPDGSLVMANQITTCEVRTYIVNAGAYVLVATKNYAFTALSSNGNTSIAGMFNINSNTVYIGYALGYSQGGTGTDDYYNLLIKPFTIPTV